ncbi:MAG: isoaspartyl peptidase/L-asparaginase, partial [Planctomycetales bacterium]|nr:isoaspartyl peptidase/L-asparaginase [Planctomycetales bacterium]
MPAILVHGGAGKPDPTRPDRELGRREGLEAAVRAGSEALRKGGSALDAVEEAVKVLEDEPLFNAGTGSTLTTEGE